MMSYLIAALGSVFFVVMLISARYHNRLWRDGEDPFSLIELLLPVNLERMQQLFDPAEEWNLRAVNRPRVFRLIQRNRRSLAIQYASHMLRNARTLQRLGYAGMGSGKRDKILRGKILVDAGVPVRLRSLLLLAFLRFEQLTYTGSDLSVLRDIVSDLLPEYQDMLGAALALSQEMSLKLHQNLADALH